MKLPEDIGSTCGTIRPAMAFHSVPEFLPSLAGASFQIVPGIVLQARQEILCRR